MEASESPPTADERRDVRNVKIALWAGVAIGAVHGIRRYGLFTIGNLAMIGLGVIASVGLYAAWVALRPARS